MFVIGLELIKAIFRGGDRILNGDFDAREKFLAPHPKLANRWGARGSGGVPTFHFYFLTNKDN